jgi:hypothetical protein
MRIVLTFSLFTVGLVAAAACSPSEGSDGTCSNYFSAAVEYGKRCNLEQDGELNEANKATFDKVCQTSLSAPGVSSAYSAAIEKCTTDFKTAACGAVDCEPRVEGTLPVGAGCADGSQCLGGRCGNQRSEGGGTAAPPSGKPSYCGTCQPYLKEGEACGTSNEIQCARSLTCSNGKCAPRPTSTTTSSERVAIGGSCIEGSGESSQFKQCVSGAYCKVSFEGGTTTGKCTAELNEGDACDGTGSQCKSGLSCSNETKKCAKIQTVGVGAECSNGKRCATGSSCVFASTSSPPTCQADLAEGAACTDDGKSARCAGFARCVDGKCGYEDPNLCK